MRKAYLADLCEDYGEPLGVLNYLLDLIMKYPLLKPLLQKDVNQLKKDVEYTPEESYFSEVSECCSCEWGNGEGGCTIPCCNKSEFEDN